MLTLQIQNQPLADQLTNLLDQSFDGDLEAMLQEFLELYNKRRNRQNYSGILKWEKDGLAFQKELRSEWQ